MKTKFRITLLGLFTMLFYCSQAQNIDSLSAVKAEKEAAISGLKSDLAALEGEVAALNEQLITYPYWDKGLSGMVGIDINSFNNWWNRGPNLNSSAVNIGFSFNGFANKFGENYFWRSNGNLVLGWQKFSQDEDDDSDFDKVADVFNVQSLYGRKLSDKFALSAFGELRTTFLENSFNPAYLDFGIGFTWTPISELVVVFHPLNENIIIADDKFGFNSSLGCKIVADYNRAISSSVSYRSNLSAFMSYEDLDFLSNYTWINGLQVKVAKDFGIGMEFAIRRSNQETVNLEDDFQSYFLMGLTYNL